MTTVLPPDARTFGFVARLAALAAEAVDTDAALHTALAEICAFTGWPVGHLLVARRGEVAGLPIWHGAGDPSFDAFRRAGTELRLPPGQGLAGRVAADGRASWMEDVGRSASFVRRESALAAGIRAAIAVPLSAAGQVAGVLELFHRDAVRPTGELLALLEVVAAELGRMVERRRAAERLTSSEDRYRRLFESARDAIFLIGDDGLITAVNPAACRLVGHREDELVGGPFTGLVAAEWRDLVASRNATLLSGREASARYEVVLADRAGTRIPVETQANALADSGQIFGVQAVVRDTANRTRAQRALRECERRCDAVFDTAPGGMAIVSLDRRWLKVNGALSDLLGQPAEAILGSPVAEAPPRAVESLLRRLHAGETTVGRVQARLLRPDGAELRALVAGTLVRDDEGAGAYAVVHVLPRAGAGTEIDSCPLSPRERQVLGLAAAGHTSASAAARLGVGAETVQTHLRRGTAKLGARTRAHAVALAIAHGWVDPAGPDPDGPGGRAVSAA